ncbi:MULTISPECIES: hypothetical protein [unclassified Gordonia (in: high G+C Gram-positive bacteria)]
MHDAFSGRARPVRDISTARAAFFILARPTETPDRFPATIGEPDVFFSEEEALDALDVHFAWCHARVAELGSAVESAQWYLQSAMVGPRLAPALGEVYLAATDRGTNETWAAAGGFLTEGELTHWSPFVHAVAPMVLGGRHSDALTLAYRGDTAVHFHRLWFAPMHSARVYPRPIMLDEESAG